MRPPSAVLAPGDPNVLDFEAFEAAAGEYDAAVAAAGLPDPFCARSDWIVPARRAFAGPDAKAWIQRWPEGWAPVMRIDTVLGRTVVPLEFGWGFAAPLIGPDPAALAARFADAMLARRERWDALFLSGLTRGGEAFTTLVHRLRRRWTLRLGETSIRRVASLDGGLDGWLSRRTPRFRKNLRREARRAGDRFRFTVDHPTDGAVALALYDAILDVEARSWKGEEGVGITSGPMRVFYAEMVPRLARRGALRITRAWEGGEPVGYVLGGLADGVYRGLQISYDDRHREAGLGNLMQAETIRWLAEHETVHAYDLGGDMPYKARWAERTVETVPLLVR